MKLNVGVLLVACCTVLTPTQSDARVTPGDTPELEVTTVTGELVSLEELRGNVVVVEFWATWCEPCLKSFAFYRELLDEFDEGLVVLAISVDSNPKSVRAFLDEHPVPFLVAIDARMRTARRFEPATIPTTYVIQRDGQVLSVHSGFGDRTRTLIDGEIRGTLAHVAARSGKVARVEARTPSTVRRVDGRSETYACSGHPGRTTSNCSP